MVKEEKPWFSWGYYHHPLFYTEWVDRSLISRTNLLQKRIDKHKHLPPGPVRKIWCWQNIKDNEEENVRLLLINRAATEGKTSKSGIWKQGAFVSGGYISTRGGKKELLLLFVLSLSLLSLSSSPFINEIYSFLF